MFVDVRVPLAKISLGPAKVYFHYCHSYCLLKVYFQTPSTRSRVLWRTETFFLRIRLPSTLNRRFRAPKTKGFQIRSSGWTVLKTEIHRIRMDRRKRRFSNTTDDVMPRFQACSSAHTIQKRYVWTHLNTEKKNRFRKYPATCGRSKTI